VKARPKWRDEERHERRGVNDRGRKAAAEFAGTAFLLGGVTGSGIMGETLSGGNDAIALLANSLATAGLLFVLIVVLAPVSGAHFNPAVTLALWMEGRIAARPALAYGAAQFAGAIAGVWLAHAMFDLPILQVSEQPRSSAGQWIAEGIATFGLVATILLLTRKGVEALAAAVGLYILAAYWFTASTSFANPAASVARSLTATFVGIAPVHAPAFVASQIGGAMLAVLAVRALVPAAKA
jgi:glycerol uptake facilitator-like aquaporin